MKRVDDVELDFYRRVVNTTVNDRAPALSARLALTKSVRKQAYELRYAGYLTAGYINDRGPVRMLRDEFDESSTSQTVVLYKDLVPAASARFCLFDPGSRNPDAAKVPAMETFPNEIANLVTANGKLDYPARAAEITRLARHPRYGKDFSLVSGIFRMMGYLILHHEVDYVMIYVGVHHIPFYRRLGYDVIAARRDHPQLSADGVLMACGKSKFDVVCRSCSIMRGLSRQDEIYERFVQGDLVPIIFSKEAPASTHSQIFSASRASAEPMTRSNYAGNLVAFDGVGIPHSAAPAKPRSSIQEFVGVA